MIQADRANTAVLVLLDLDSNIMIQADRANTVVLVLLNLYLAVLWIQSDPDPLHEKGNGSGTSVKSRKLKLLSHIQTLLEPTLY